ncbi:2-hydroxy-6-oxononadienedioate/2-hydroxy-6-oxononatrienedioate hydrolase [Aspergillus sclerotioniger CBS 115572]|uniref:2-hydroxy-6-oxononadienedioate/2-hydroxy-6-oxononatrienedioate hydrolase n=1 Tax=Aspergillus sclerotioniger CBS 115572 TaxID=1450535 RepID=A0A317WUX8_9EURO|nr:2-hydroxy-6-oxononadienedioate/2-hydroxy-6-oxononatrienedioate hydrolase [Aspergillus sclerotioniger CBS 115572]PWY89621.1 2-hydroxy-6-oxononadienedioate/2-hydroxy-6-oxononatrienedioate hydrolase [Aspergillus sclerotioniger CBS 115572]
MPPTPVVTEHILINNHRIAYGIHSPPTSTSTTTPTPIILIHGTPSSSLIWRHIIPPLTTTGYKVHVYDLLSYGLSERPWDPKTDTSISGQVPILLSLLDHWSITSAHIIAHDIGGGIAQRFCILHPDKINILSLTLIDTVSFNSYPSERTKAQMQEGLETLIQAPNGTHREHFKEWILSTVTDTGKMRMEEEGSLDAYLEYISNPVGQASFFQHQVKHYDSRHTMEVAGRIGELGRVPVMIVWGREDRWQVLQWGENLKRCIPGAELSVIDGGGHFVMEDRPEVVGEVVRGFLGRVDR